MKPAYSLAPWEAIAQRTTWAPDENYTSERTEECGQACIVMCLRYLTGVWTSTAYLHDLVHNQGEVTGTTLEQMLYTIRLMETHCYLSFPVTPADMIQLIKTQIDAGRPLIVLRYFQSPGSSTLHFCCITGYTPDVIQLAGPWSGTMFTEDYKTFESMYAGGIVVLQRKRMLGDH